MSRDASFHITRKWREVRKAGSTMRQEFQPYQKWFRDNRVKASDLTMTAIFKGKDPGEDRGSFDSMELDQRVLLKGGLDELWNDLEDWNEGSVLKQMRRISDLTVVWCLADMNAAQLFKLTWSEHLDKK